MVTKNELIEMWHVDCKMDPTDIEKESLKSPLLHCKYTALRMQAKEDYKRMEVELQALTQEKSDFYVKGSDEYWRGKGWKERPEGRILKNDLKYVLPQDEHLQDLKIKLGVQEAKVDALDGILREIHNRQWHIKNINETRRFNSGG